jgi:hypothetical protein
VRNKGQNNTPRNAHVVHPVQDICRLACSYTSYAVCNLLLQAGRTHMFTRWCMTILEMTPKRAQSDTTRDKKQALAHLSQLQPPSKKNHGDDNQVRSAYTNTQVQLRLSCETPCCSSCCCTQAVKTAVHVLRRGQANKQVLGHILVHSSTLRTALHSSIAAPLTTCQTFSS